MSQRSGSIAGKLTIRALLIISICACIHCLNPASYVSLEYLSSNGQWLNTGTKLRIRPPVIGRIGDAVLATITFSNSRLFSGESLVVQARLYDFQPQAHFIEGFALGKLAENLFQGQRMECKSLRLLRSDKGKLLIGGIFVFGQFRIELPITEAQPAVSYKDAFLRLREFAGDRVPITWELKDIIDGALRTFEPKPELKSHVQQAKLLTWKIIGYYWWPGQGYYVGHCILWIRCDNPKQWTLAHVIHIARDTPFRWSLAWVEYSPPFWIKRFDHAPTKEEIVAFLNANEWWSAPRELECKLLDAEICANAWEKVTGQKPTRAFKKDSIPRNQKLPIIFQFQQVLSDPEHNIEEKTLLRGASSCEVPSEKLLDRSHLFDLLGRIVDITGQVKYWCLNSVHSNAKTGQN